MSTYKTTGIILRRTNYGEADRILTFLTPAHGKVEAIAKGVRRITAKLGSHLEPFNEIELMLAKGRSLDVVTSARLKRKFDRLMADYDRLRRAFLFCEMANKLTEHNTTPELYQLLAQSLAALNGGLPAEFIELYFKLHLLSETGHQPQLESAPDAQYYFSLSDGKVVTSAGGESVPITPDEIKLWRLIMDYPPGQIAKVKGIGEAAISSLSIIDRFYDYLFDKRFKSSEI